jgi:hypothetical protein
MSPSEDTPHETQAQLERRRRDAELRLNQVRTALATEIGIVPRKKTFLLVLAAGAAGFALALRGGRRRQRRRSRLED